jgi:hypothetical protein
MGQHRLKAEDDEESVELARRLREEKNTRANDVSAAGAAGALATAPPRPGGCIRL